MLKNGINYSTEELVLTIPGGEFYNDETGMFFTVKEQTLRLKHSLLSISKWEAKYERPFLDEKHPHDAQETLDYVRFMTLTQNVDPDVYNRLNNLHIQLVNKYIDAKMNGTIVYDDKPQKGAYKKAISAELIYYWMTEFNIPWECNKWHLSRLLMLIRVCSIKKAQANEAANPKKGRKSASRDYRAINRSRRNKHHSKG